MKDELTQEMDHCRQLYDVVMASAEGSNEYEDALLESDSARNGLCDMVHDYIAYARQMTIDKMPDDPLRYAGSSLRRIRLEWNVTRFFDRMTYHKKFREQIAYQGVAMLIEAEREKEQEEGCRRRCGKQKVWRLI